MPAAYGSSLCWSRHDAMNHLETLKQRIDDRTAHLVIIGMGYVGLPLAIVFAEAGFRVTGLDLDQAKVDGLNAGLSHIEDIPTTQITRLVAQERLRATTDPQILQSADAVSICVPTPLRKTRDPDISAIVSTAEAIGQHLHPGMLIVLESTTYPGTTSEILLPRLQAAAPHLTVGEDFFLCFSPERVDPGRNDWTTVNTPKVIGGVTPACMQAGIALYQHAIQNLVQVSSPEAAEMTKLLENTFRAVNIGLVNEVMLMCDKLGLDVWEVIDAASTKPFGFMKFTPGPGLGGHCIPIDPLYLSWKLKTLNYNARFIELASEVNTSMPHYWVQKVQDRLNDVGKSVRNSHILVLGIAYKKNVSDIRESPALDILHLLRERGAGVQYHDPFVPTLKSDGLDMKSITDLPTALAAADLVVVVTDHDSYDWRQVASHARLLVDTRNAVQRGTRERR